MINIGLVGAGGMGKVHFNNYKKVRNCKVIALVGKSETDRNQAKLWNIPIYTTMEEMVEKENINLIDICLPTFLHYKNALTSLTLGKHTIVEKPLAFNIKETTHLYNTAEENGLLLFVAHCLQFSKEIKILRRIVKYGRYGKPIDAFFERLAAIPTWSRENWFFQKEKSGFIPFDLHIHDLDIILSLFGIPENYTCKSSCNINKEFPDHYSFTYEYPNLNVTAVASWQSANTPFIGRWRVSFENGLVVYDGEKVIAYEPNKAPLEFDNTEQIMISTGINLPPTGWYYNELLEFIKCIEKNTPSKLVPKEQVIAGINILETFN